MSYTNVIMYSSVLPSYNFDKDKKNSRNQAKKGMNFGQFTSQLKQLKNK